MESSNIIKLISEFLVQSPLNNINQMRIEKIYETPLVGIAAADDLLFDQVKNDHVIGSHHMSPKQWLHEANSVISYFLPFSLQIRRANREAGLPAVEWLYGRKEGEICNEAIRQFIVEQIVKSNAKAVAPVLDSRLEIIDITSNWSERHVAFIAGLGTFGLSKSLITNKGCAGRFGSIITSLNLEPTPRKYQDIYEYCTMCGLCISRCPAHAISKAGKDNKICDQYIQEVVDPIYFPPYSGCGKCETKLPCENANPTIKKRHSNAL